MHEEKKITKKELGSQLNMVGLSADTKLKVAGKVLPVKLTITEFVDENFDRPSIKSDILLGKIHGDYYFPSDIKVKVKLVIGENEDFVVSEMEHNVADNTMCLVGGSKKKAEIKKLLLSNFSKKKLYKNGIKKNKNQLYYTVSSKTDEVIDMLSVFIMNAKGTWIQVLSEELDFIDSTSNTEIIQ